MSDRRTGGSRAGGIAIAAAAVALVTSLVAVIVVVRRAEPPVPRAAMLEQHVAATDLMRLRRQPVEPVTEAGTVVGVKIPDDAVRKAFGLEPTDILVALGGRAIRLERDLHDAVFGLTMMEATTVDVDLLRARQPVLVRWRLDGDLRTARRDDATRGSPSGGTGGAGGTGVGGVVGGLGTIDPPPPIMDDPVLATIRQLDDVHYEIPRASVDKLLANPMAFMKGARVVPSVKNGLADGFKLYAIRPSSVLAAIGLQNGDTLHAINGFPLDTAEKALEVYTKVRDASSLELELTRRGKPVLLTLTIR
jgi:S1-C subfamily serine protease